MNEETKSKFGQLRLSVKGTSNGQGFDIFYDFGKTHNFVEFTSKPEFFFIQPWMQFPSKEYTDECMRVSIELVRRFNDFTAMQDHLQSATELIKILRQRVTDLEEKNAYLQEFMDNHP